MENLSTLPALPAHVCPDVVRTRGVICDCDPRMVEFQQVLNRQAAALRHPDRGGR